MLASEYFKQEKLDKVALGLFEELCRSVGTDLDDPKLDVGEGKRKIWHYEAYEWTEKEEKAFVKWAVEWVFAERPKVGLHSKKAIKNHFIPMWVLNYSWRIKK